jgi:hypothetical protein
MVNWAEGNSSGMSLSKRLIGGRAVLMALAGGSLWLAPGLTWAATFNQNLGIWQDGPEAAPNLALEEVPLVVVDPVGVLPPVAKPRPQAVAPVKVKTPVPTPAAARAPSNVEIINKLLMPGASDPDVPLPHRDLADSAGDSASANGPARSPRMFGRGEQGGGVFGLSIPIPADRHAPSTNTRSGGGRTGSETAPETR